MSAEQNRKIAERFYEILNSGNLDLYREIVPDNFIDRNPVPGQAPGLAGLKQALADFLSAFPDMKFTIEDIMVCGDQVVVRTTGKGTHRNTFMGIRPTGKKIEFGTIDIHHIVGNKIVESWHIEELLSIMVQLGAVQS